MSLDPVEFLRRLRIALRVLTSDWKMHGVSPANITSNHPLMSDVLPNLPPHLGFYLEILQRI